MSFSPITSGEITSGQPVSAPTQTKYKDNFDDHETRIEDLEAFTTDFIPGTYDIVGKYFVNDNVLKITSNSTLNLIGVKILVNVAGGSGTLEIDIKRSRSGGGYVSIFSTRPSVAFGAGNDAISSNAVLDPTKVDVLAGDILRLDITSAQTDGMGFVVRVDYNRG